eukprot:m.340685 g.340685  ORF g.340685 m.340685 type:complete len:99 (-) comp19460_c0_seq1:70-366(-)
MFVNDVGHKPSKPKFSQEKGARKSIQSPLVCVPLTTPHSQSGDERTKFCEAEANNNNNQKAIVNCVIMNQGKAYYKKQFNMIHTNRRPKHQTTEITLA